MTDNVEAKTSNIKQASTKRVRVKKLPFNWKVIAVMVVIVLALGTAFYYWNEAQTAKSSTPEAVAAKNQEESARVIESLSLILYTESEDEPTVARIEDPEVLKNANQDFYKNAQTGDYLVLYPNRAIIYRETEKQVINVAPIINTSAITPSQ